MQKFEVFSSKVIPLPMKDVDTDLIIPAQYLTSISRDGYGQNVFRRLRDSNPDFPFNKDEYKNSHVLVVDSNFGCGSSREHAVWALQDAGIKVILGKSFADIFFNNSLKNGLLPITLEAETIDQILTTAASADYKVTIDLANQTVQLEDGKSASFTFDPFRKHCLLNGLDDINYILSHESDLVAFNKKRPAFSTLTLA